MRNRILLSAFALLLGTGGLFAQACTPSQFVLLLGIPGVYPNPAQQPNLAAGSVGSAYSEVITIVTVADTTIDLSSYVGFPVPPVQVSVDYQKVNNVTGLPPGLSYGCFPSSCSIPGDSSGCVGISGTPTLGGTYTVVMESVMGFTVPPTVPVIGGTVQEMPVPGTSWDMEVAGGVGIEDMNSAGFSMSQNSPNPFSGSTTILYNSAKPATVQFELRDLTGRVLHREALRAHVGENSHEFDAQGIAAGAYIFSLDNGSKVLTRKMIISE